VLAAWKYRVQVSKDPTFSGTPDAIDTEQSCWTTIKGYDDGTYYWHVAMYDGNQKMGDYSTYQTFTKQYPITTLLSPVNGSRVSTTPTFVWSPVDGAARYKLETSLYSNFSPTVESIQTDNTRYTPTRVYSSITPYYWRVAIVDSDGKIGPFNNATIIVNNLPTFNISGNTGLGGVTLSYTNGVPMTATSALDGSYSFSVPSGWSGTVTPTLAGFHFSPDHRDYTNISANQPNQNYSAYKSFLDVPTTYWAYSYIERLYAAGITGGCGGGNYCPETAVSRGQMAVFLERGMNGSSYTPPAATGTVFGDVPTSYWSASWIEKLFADGITGGCGGGNYCPETVVTRGQMAVFLLRAKHGSSYTPPPATGVFPDVPTSYWAASWIEQLYAESITGGCGGGNYCPDQSVTRGQMAVFLVRTFNLP
jgi:hypothetical protein